jgi:hypothetical protein
VLLVSALLLGPGLALVWGFFPLILSREAGASPVTGGVCATAIGALCRDSFGLFAGLRVMTLAAFHALGVGATVPLGLVKPLIAVTLSGGPFFVGPLDNDQEVADPPQFENLSLVFWDLDQDQGEGFFGPDGNHPGHLDWCQALVHQVGLNVVEADLRSEHGTEFFLLGESERVARQFPLLEQVDQHPEIVGGNRIDTDGEGDFSLGHRA